jgi:hypothetical protein
MPTITTFGTASARGFGFGAGSTGLGFIGLLGDASTASVGASIATDSSGNFYLDGRSVVSSLNAFQVVKYNSSVAIQYQKSLSASPSTSSASALAVDSSGNLFAYGNYDDATTGPDTILAKYDSSGVLQWQKYLRSGGAGFANDYSGGVAVDSSGNVYTSAEILIGSTAAFSATKFDSSGTLVWSRALNSTGNNEGATSIALDSSANVYVGGYSNVSTDTYLQLAKYSSAGTFSWQRRLGTTSALSGSYGVAVDSSGNVYAAGYTTVSGSQRLLVTKYNTSGTFQWVRSLGNSFTSTAFSIALDSSSNVYVGGSAYDSGTGIEAGLIAKYDTSGNLLWQRTLTRGTSTRLYGIAVDSTLGNIYITGQCYGSSGPYQIIFAKFQTSF